MKTTLTTVAMATVLSTAAFADSLDIEGFGVAEYELEADVVTTTVGADFGVDRWTFTPAIALDNDGQDYAFAEAEFTVNYQANDAVNLYGTIETDQDFDYEETTFGVEFRF